MDEQQLSRYIASYGDRIAVIEFAKRKVNAKREGLVEKLRKKIMGKRKRLVPFSNSGKGSSDESDSETDHKQCITTTKSSHRTMSKSTRLILIGWLTTDSDGSNPKQVRSRQGGGTRRVSVPKSNTVADILNTAIDLFFPNGISKSGHRDLFSFKLWDFRRENIECCNLTVEEMYAYTKVTTLRFYLASKKVEIITVEPEVIESPLTIEQYDLVASEEDRVQHHSQEVVTFIADYENQVSTDISLSNQIVNLDLPILDNTIDCITTNVDGSEATTIGNEQPLKLTLHRGQCFQELMEIVRNINVDNDHIVFVDMLLPNGNKEMGVDSGGIFRDALAEFWRDFYEKCTVGTNYKVPIIRHDFDGEKWTTVAKILVRGWKQEKVFPIKLAPAFVKHCLYGNSNCESEILDNFLKYLSFGDSETILNSLTNYETVDNDELLTVLEPFQCKWTPDKNNIKKLITDIAHSELIQKPMYIINCWTLVLSNLMNEDMLGTMYLKNAATSKNIIPRIKFDNNLHSEEIKIIGYLKKFIKEADEITLNNFLRFCTGSDMITQDINLQFNSTVGLLRTPIGRTCGCTLELSTTYDNYPDFRFELNNILHSNVWIMDFA